MHFASDNWAGSLPEITEAVAGAMAGYSGGYGNDDFSQSVQARLGDLFECELDLFYASTGTAANALSLATLMQEGGIVLAHANAHVIVDECGSVEFYSRGRLRGLASDADRPDDGKISAAGLRSALAELLPPNLHHGRPVALTLTQATEQGTIYAVDELNALGAIAHENGLKVHMDGARFANALVASGAAPAELTWKAGVDIMSFGATKNGAMLAEAVLVFDRSLTENLRYLHKRAGQLFSKSRVIGAQFDAYLKEDRWLAAARNANAQAARLAEGLRASNTVRFGWPVEANEMFVVLPKDAIARLRAAGAVFYDWPASSMPEGARPTETEGAIRLVTSFATTADDVARFLALLG